MLMVIAVYVCFVSAGLGAAVSTPSIFWESESVADSAIQLELNQVMNLPAFVVWNNGGYSPEGYVTLTTDSSNLQLLNAVGYGDSTSTIYNGQIDQVWDVSSTLVYFDGYLADAFKAVDTNEYVGFSSISIKPTAYGIYHVYWRAALNTSDVGYDFVRDPSSGHTDSLGYYAKRITIEVVELTPPSISISSLLDNQFVTNPTITVYGTASDNVAVSKVEIKTGAENWEQASLSGTSWSKSITLSSGSNTIYARATDTCGNTRIVSINVICDITPPSITIKSPEKDTTVSVHTIKVSGTVSDENGIASLEVNGKSVSTPTNWDVDINLVEGTNTITVVATDNAGNTATEIITLTYTSPATVDWIRTFGGINPDGIYDVQQTSDGGYILAGYLADDDSLDMWLEKLKSDGTKSWSETYGTYDFFEGASSLLQTSDGGYILAGYTIEYKDYSLYYDAYVVKTDSSGKELWNKTYGGNENDLFISIFQISDGGYILAGKTESYGAGMADAWLVKIDSDGGKIWDKTFGGSGDDRLTSALQLTDGGYILAGTTYLSGSSQGWLIMTNSEGETIWGETYGGPTSDSYFSVRSVQQTNDEGYILVGSTDLDAYLVKTDSSGKELWSETFGGNDFDEFTEVHQTNGGGYILAGTTGGIDVYDEVEDCWYTSYDAWLVKIDSAGNVVWDKVITGYDFPNVFQQTSDGGYILGGEYFIGVANSDGFLIKIEGDLDAIPTIIPTTMSIKSIGNSGYLTNSNFDTIIDVKDQYGYPITTGLTFDINLPSYADIYFNTPTVTSSGDDYIVKIQQHGVITMKVPVTITATNINGNKISKSFDLKYASDWVDANADADIIFNNIESGVQVDISAINWRKITKINQNFYFAFPTYDDERGYSGYLVVDENGNIPTNEIVEKVVFAAEVGPFFQSNDFANDMNKFGEHLVYLSTFTKLGEEIIGVRDGATKILGFIGGTYTGGTFTHAINTHKYVSSAVNGVKFINGALGKYNKIGEISESTLRITGRSMMGLHGAQTYLISSEVNRYPYDINIYDYELCKELKFLWETSVAGGVIGVELAASETPSADFESQVNDIIWNAADGAGLPTNIINYGNPLDKSLKIMGNAALRGQQVTIYFEDYNILVNGKASYSSSIFPSSENVFTNMADLNALLPTEKPIFRTIMDVSLIDPYSSTMDLLPASDLIKKTLDGNGIDYYEIDGDCPSDMLIVNETGARIGFFDGSFINEIENAYLLSLGEFESYILPANHTYSIKIISGNGSDSTQPTSFYIKTNVGGNSTFLAYTNLSIFDNSSINITLSDTLSDSRLSFNENNDSITKMVCPDSQISLKYMENNSTAYITKFENKSFTYDDNTNDIEITLFSNVSYNNEAIQISKNNTAIAKTDFIPIKSININPSNNISKSMEWANIKIFYTDQELGMLNISESSLKIYWLNGTDWEKVDTKISSTQNYLFANITHFSEYAIGGQTKADLVINETSLKISNTNPTAGDVITIDTTIYNTGNSSADGFNVCLYVDGAVENNYYTSVTPKSNTTIRMQWTTTVGIHNITVNADSLELIDETNETNNNVTEQITVKAYYSPPQVSSGGGGGGSGSSGEAFENIAVKDVVRMYIAKDNSITYEFKEDANSIGFVSFDAKTNAGYITATVEVLNNLSTIVSSAPSGEVYQNMNIWIGLAGFATDNNIANPVIGFKVLKSWINENDIDESTIKLNRYSSGAWNQLPTTKTNEDDNYIYFSSETPGFSPFSISGYQKSSAVIANVQDSSDTMSSVAKDDIKASGIEPVDVPNNEDKSSGGLTALVSLIGISILSVGIFLKKEEIGKWINQRRS